MSTYVRVYMYSNLPIPGNLICSLGNFKLRSTPVVSFLYRYKLHLNHLFMRSCMKLKHGSHHAGNRHHRSVLQYVPSDTAYVTVFYSLYMLVSKGLGPMRSLISSNYLDICKCSLKDNRPWLLPCV